MRAGCSSSVLNSQLFQTITSVPLGFHIFQVTAEYQNVLYILCLSWCFPFYHTKQHPEPGVRERRGRRRRRNVCCWFAAISMGEGAGCTKGLAWSLFPV